MPPGQDKTTLRSNLEGLLREAHSNPAAAHAALRACVSLRVPIPPPLLTPENLAGAFQPRDIARFIGRLAAPALYIDVSAALDALRTAITQDPPSPPAPRFLNSLTTSVTSSLFKLSASPRHRQLPAPRPRRPNAPQARFTAATISSATKLALSVLRRFTHQHGRPPARREKTVLLWARTVDALWRTNPTLEALTPALDFAHDLRSALSPDLYSSLIAEPSVARFFSDTNSSASKFAEDALLRGSLGDLETLLFATDRTPNGRAPFVSRLREVCQTRPADLVPEAIEWVARHVESVGHRPAAPQPADPSQSAALDNVAVCLLAAWDAAPEGKQATGALEVLRRMTREVFRVDLAGTPGEIAPYNELEYELKASLPTRPTRVAIVRPAVRWSDGIRTRVLIRALVEPAR